MKSTGGANVRRRDSRGTEATSTACCMLMMLSPLRTPLRYHTSGVVVVGRFTLVMVPALRAAPTRLNHQRLVNPLRRAYLLFIDRIFKAPPSSSTRHAAHRHRLSRKPGRQYIPTHAPKQPTPATHRCHPPRHATCSTPPLPQHTTTLAATPPAAHAPMQPRHAACSTPPPPSPPSSRAGNTPPPPPPQHTPATHCRHHPRQAATPAARRRRHPRQAAHATQHTATASPAAHAGSTPRT